MASYERARSAVLAVQDVRNSAARTELKQSMVACAPDEDDRARTRSIRRELSIRTVFTTTPYMDHPCLVALER
jgi:hypothetical protein